MTPVGFLCQVLRTFLMVGAVAPWNTRAPEYGIHTEISHGCGSG